MRRAAYGTGHGIRVPSLASHDQGSGDKKWIDYFGETPKCRYIYVQGDDHRDTPHLEEKP
jgi:hypothetical protein